MVIDEAIIHPTSLIRVSEVLDVELLEKAKAEAVSLSEENVAPMGQSNPDCYRTILPNIESNYLNNVCQILEQKLSDVLTKRGITLMFGAEFWLNVNGTGSSNDAHAHYGSALSGVYYLDALGTGPLVFHSIHKTMGTSSYCDVSQSDFKIEPTNNSMVIFPSWALHSVAENASECDRICIAFNAR